MAEHANITRRSILKATSLIGATLALPATAKATETPLDRVTRLSEELADALNDYANAKFHAVVYPSNDTEWPVAFVSNNSTTRK